MRGMEGKEVKRTRTSVGDVRGVSKYCPMALKECQPGVKQAAGLSADDFYGKEILFLGIQKYVLLMYFIVKNIYIRYLKVYLCKIISLPFSEQQQ